VGGTVGVRIGVGVGVGDVLGQVQVSTIGHPPSAGTDSQFAGHDRNPVES
jgi:hypothetical protein